MTPSALQTGHISVEERLGEVWVDAYGNSRTAVVDASREESGAFVSTATSSIAGGVRLNDFDDPSEQAGSEVSEMPPSDHNSTAASGTGKQSTRGLPTHLRRGTSTVASSSIYDRSVQAELLSRAEAPSMNPPRPSTGPGSVSTATTVRQERQLVKENRQVPFNRWNNQGVQHQGCKTRTTTSSVTSGPSEGSHRTSNANWPKMVAEKNPEALKAIPVVRAASGEKEFNAQKCKGFCPSDDEEDDY